MTKISRILPMLVVLAVASSFIGIPNEARAQKPAKESIFEGSKWTECKAAPKADPAKFCSCKQRTVAATQKDPKFDGKIKQVKCDIPDLTKFTCSEDKSVEGTITPCRCFIFTRSTVKAAKGSQPKWVHPDYSDAGPVKVEDKTEYSCFCVH